MPTFTLRGTFSWPLFLMFLLFFVPWCWYTGKSVYALLRYEAAEGIIQDMAHVPPQKALKPNDQPTSSIGMYTHRAIFTALDGRQGQALTRVRSNPPAFKVGDRVKVYYDPADPARAMIGTFWELWLAPLVLGFFAGVFLLLWVGALVGDPAPAHPS